MANNQLIKGAALTSKKFLDIGAAVASGFSRAGSGSQRQQENPRVAKNKAIQSRVNSYMSKMKTDMDFTSFSPGETATMRNFLVGRRGEYARAAKAAGEMTDTTDPKYMEYVDIMQGVNNSFVNLSKQLESYKQGKIDYAQGQSQGMFSKGTPDQLASDTAAMYGFWDHDEDKSTRREGGYDSPFTIQQNGNLGFDVDGTLIDYNEQAPLGLKDYKLANSIVKDNENAFKAGKLQNASSLDAYRLQLEQSISTPDQIQSMIFDFNNQIKTRDLQDAITRGGMELLDAKDELINRLVNSRNEVSRKGYNNARASSQAAYDLKQKRKGGTTKSKDTGPSYDPKQYEAAKIAVGLEKTLEENLTTAERRKIVTYMVELKNNLK